jgi:pimeloyl-ACP methyl ester carboxylesterase
LPRQPPTTTVVLVHGAFADGSCWSKSPLEKDGYSVIAVQESAHVPCRTTWATTKRVIDAQKGPVIVVGHSYGGSVITDAAAGNPNVKALVYIAAFAPVAGQSISGESGQYPAPPLNAALVPDAAGFLYIDRAKFHDDFCKDVPEDEARIMAVTQKPISGSVFARNRERGVELIPSWYLVCTEDRAINLTSSFYAQRIRPNHGIRLSHVAFLSNPKAVVKIIEEAAKALLRRRQADP